MCNAAVRHSVAENSGLASLRLHREVQKPQEETLHGRVHRVKYAVRQTDNPFAAHLRSKADKRVRLRHSAVAHPVQAAAA